MQIILFFIWINYVSSGSILPSMKSKISKIWSSITIKTTKQLTKSSEISISTSALQSTQTILKDEIPPLSKEPPLNILLLVEPTPFNYISGYANRFKEMLDHLKLAGDSVHVITTDGSKSPPKSYQNYSITTLSGTPLPMYQTVRVSFDVRWRVKEWIQKFRPDLIHVSSPSIIMFPAILWSKIFKVPLVMSYHTHIIEYFKNYIKIPGSIGFAKWLLRLTHNTADMTLCTSPQLKEDMEEIGIKNLEVWMKGINTKIFSPIYRNNIMRKKLSENHPDAPLLIYVGRLGKEKKLTRLRKVLDAVPNARLAIVGHGPAEDSLKDYFKGYPVHFVGSLTGISLSQAFASADIFVMPSDSETLGFVVLEAMASGLPVVAVNAGGLPDIVEHNQNGYLVKNDDEDVEEFIQYTRLLIENKEDRERIGKQARKWAENWSWEAATSKLRNIHYRKAIANYRENQKQREQQEQEQRRLVSDFDYYYRPDLTI